MSVPFHIARRNGLRSPCLHVQQARLCLLAAVAGKAVRNVRPQVKRLSCGEFKNYCGICAAFGVIKTATILSLLGSMERCPSRK
jgi:hypothetical protein